VSAPLSKIAAAAATSTASSSRSCHALARHADAEARCRQCRSEVICSVSDHVARRQNPVFRFRPGSPSTLGQHSMAKAAGRTAAHGAYDVEITKDGEQALFKPRTDSRRPASVGHGAHLSNTSVLFVSDGLHRQTSNQRRRLPRPDGCQGAERISATANTSRGRDHRRHPIKPSSPTEVEIIRPDRQKGRNSFAAGDPPPASARTHTRAGQSRIPRKSAALKGKTNKAKPCPTAMPFFGAAVQRVTRRYALRMRFGVRHRASSCFLARASTRSMPSHRRP